MTNNNIKVYISCDSDNKNLLEKAQLISIDLNKNYGVNTNLDIKKELDLNTKINYFKSKLRSLDKVYNDYRYPLSQSDFNDISFLINEWDKLLKSILYIEDIAYILEELINLIDNNDDTNNNDATKLFIRLAFICTISYAIKTNNYQLINEMISYEYLLQYNNTTEELSYIYFNILEIECIKHHNLGLQINGSNYQDTYFSIEKDIIKSTEYSIINILEAEILLELISSLSKDEKRTWKVLVNNTHSEIKNNQIKFRFLRNFRKKENICKILKSIPGQHNTDEINNLKDINLFKVIESSKIGIVN
ncbi:hypothetical protein [Staphylococcus hominis]